jgi:hypothetical protein
LFVGVRHGDGEPNEHPGAVGTAVVHRQRDVAYR